MSTRESGTHEISVAQLEQRFVQIYGAAPRIFRAPGRVNLIGEHTDYNDGFVMPAAIDLRTYVACSARSDRLIQVQSANLGAVAEFDLDKLRDSSHGAWSDYVRGVAAVLEDSCLFLTGAHLLIDSELPLGAGLSSSAALEVATALALLATAGLQMDRRRIALACQRAEHEYVGMKCGIMDQFVSCFAQEGSAVMLDCRTLEYVPVPLSHNVRIVICNTKVTHQLAGSEYNLRRADCEAGLHILQREYPEIRALRDVTEDQLEMYRAIMGDRVYRRCRHVITENARVERAVLALKSGDLQSMGRLMAESHRNLQQDFEVSCRELDIMVEIARELPGVYGARMTGGGFGGSTVNLVSDSAVAKFCDEVAKRYRQATGIEPDLYVCSAVEGAAEIPVAASMHPNARTNDD